MEGRYTLDQRDTRRWVLREKGRSVGYLERLVGTPGPAFRAMPLTGRVAPSPNPETTSLHYTQGEAVAALIAVHEKVTQR